VPIAQTKHPRSSSLGRSASLALLLAAFLLQPGCQDNTPPLPPEDNDPSDKPSAAKNALPADLALVPPDAAAFLHVRLADLWKKEAFADLRQLVAKAGPQILQVFDQQYLPAPSTLDRLTLIYFAPQSLHTPIFSGDPEALSPLLVVTTSKPIDKDRFQKALAREARVKQFQGQTYQFFEDTWTGLVLIDDRTFAVGSEDAVVEMLKKSAAANKDGPLTASVRRAAKGPQVTAGWNPAAWTNDPSSRFLPPDIKPLLQARSATAALDLGKEARVELRFDFAQEDQAGAGRKAVRAVLDLGRKNLAQSIQELVTQVRQGGSRAVFTRVGAKKPPAGPALLPARLKDLPEQFFLLVGLGALRQTDTALQHLAVEQQGTVVRVPWKAPMMTGNMFIGSVLFIQSLGRNANNTFTHVGTTIGSVGRDPVPADNFKKLARAFGKYHAAHGHYPPAARFNKDGEAVLSWRVELLPYLGEGALHKQFKLDEPWDSLHNKKLLKKMPAVFKSPWSWTPWKTRYQAFAGKGSVFDGKEGVRKRDIKKGVPTILVAEAESFLAVAWTKPADLPYAADKLPDVFSPTSFGFSALLVDGTVQTITKSIKPETLHAWIRRGGK
jgi:hypothetical protein